MTPNPPKDQTVCGVKTKVGTCMVDGQPCSTEPTVDVVQCFKSKVADKQAGQNTQPPVVQSTVIRPITGANHPPTNSVTEDAHQKAIAASRQKLKSLRIKD